MRFLNQFTLCDIFLVIIGLIVASIYSLCKEQKRLEEADSPVREQYEHLYAYVDSKK